MRTGAKREPSEGNASSWGAAVKVAGELRLAAATFVSGEAPRPRECRHRAIADKGPYLLQMAQISSSRSGTAASNVSPEIGTLAGSLAASEVTGQH